MAVAEEDADRGGGGPGAPGAGHVYGLDLLRVAAAVLVAVFHLTWRYPPLSWVPPIGWVGVQAFFVLSGFVIAGSVVAASPESFLRKRAARLYPTAWICTALALLAILGLPGAHAPIRVYVASDVQAAAASLALVGNRFLSGSFWSLQVEIAFYLVMAAALASKRRPSLETIAKLLIVWSAPFAGLAFGDAVGLFANPLPDPGYGVAAMTLIRHGHYFGLGVLLFVAAAEGGPRRSHAAWIAVAALLASFEIASRAVEIVGKAAGTFSALEVFAGAFALWCAAAAAMAAAIRFRARAPKTAAGRRATRAAGLATYPFYLLHEAFGASLMGALALSGSGPFAALGGALAATAAVSLMVASVWEPALKRVLARRGSAGPRAVEAPPAQ